MQQRLLAHFSTNKHKCVCMCVCSEHTSQKKSFMVCAPSRISSGNDASGLLCGVEGWLEWDHILCISLRSSTGQGMLTNKLEGHTCERITRDEGTNVRVNVSIDPDGEIGVNLRGLLGFT